MRNNKSNKGFTLIELLIVIAIIGILAAVLIPNLLSARTRAYDTAAQTCARSLATGAEMYKIDNPNDNYPAHTLIAKSDALATAFGTNACSPSTIVISSPEDSLTATGYTYVVHDTRGNSQYTITEQGMDEPDPIPAGG